MGTNYYTESAPKCPTCGHQESDLHIGKSSSGWKFIFMPHTSRGLTSWAKWKDYLKDRVIRDEYGDVVSLDWLSDLIDSKQDGIDHRTATAQQWGPYPRTGYMDDDGYRFSEEREFS
ncbi:MAG: hypothetical protein KKG69_17900 [Alphaproteobacteria bacterium]|uniref:Uncharacterized protein n=1 Tax=viral metagenome TaxID=1070528 RepID=A0A6H1ZCK2_9ZZZZ|nr:hypothetical protein [Alphaproteobacteria bacterium]